MTPLFGFAPDADYTTPGVLVDCTNVIPFPAGFKGAPSPASTGVAALAAACKGAATLLNLDGTSKTYAGSASKLYELSSLSWTDRTRASGGDYAVGSGRWSFAAFGSSTLAANGVDTLQRATTGAFSNVSGAPISKIIETASGFAVAFNTSVTTDTWRCSAYLDETDWTLAVATQSVTGRLIDSPGAITAAKRFGNDIIAYKARSMYRGTYVGAPEVWRWTQVSTDAGCIGIDAVVDTPVGHIFVGADNLYIFDGTTPKPFGVGVIRDWLFADMAGSGAGNVQMLWDRTNLLVWIFYSQTGATTVNRCVVWDTVSKKFGVAHTTIEAVLTFITPAVTYGSAVGTAGITTYGGSPAVPYDSLVWLGGAASPAVFTSTHTLSTLSGSCVSASFTTGDIGADSGYRMCRNLRVRYRTAPTTSTATGYTKDESGVTVATGSSNATADGKHNMRQTARWHRFAVATTGDFEASGIEPEMVEAGRR